MRKTIIAIIGVGILALAGCSNEPANAEPQTIWGEFGEQLTRLDGEECSISTITADCLTITPKRVDLAEKLSSRLGNKPKTMNIEAAFSQTSNISDEYSEYYSKICDLGPLGSANLNDKTRDCASRAQRIQVYFGILTQVAEEIG